MSKWLDVDIEVSEETLQNVLDKLADDDATMLELHNAFAVRCDKYVPMLNGPLHESGLAQVTESAVTYGGGNVPYAHYQYYGVNFNHTKEYHPLATALWDKVMMQNEGDVFTKEVADILGRRAKELYG